MRVGAVTSSTRIGVVALLALAVVGCSGAGRASRETEPQPDIDDAAIASAVDIRAIGCQTAPTRGAGAVVEGGFVLTAAHVVAGADSITVRAASPQDADAIIAHVVALDPNNDLALLATPDHDLQQLPLARGAANTVGVAIVFRDNSALAEPFVITRPVRMRIFDIYHHDTVSRSGYQVAISIEPGDSGAVLVGPTGAAVGVLYAKSRGTANRAWASSTVAVPVLISRARSIDPTEGIDAGPCVR